VNKIDSLLEHNFIFTQQLTIMFDDIKGLDIDEVSLLQGYSIDFQDKLFKAFVVEFKNETNDILSYTQDRYIILSALKNIIINSIYYAINNDEIVDHEEACREILPYIQDETNAKYPKVCDELTDYLINMLNEINEMNENIMVERLLEMFVERMSDIMEVRKYEYHEKSKKVYRETILMTSMKGKYPLSLIGGKYSFGPIRKSIAEYAGVIKMF
jgi:hypothetical protein